MKEAKWYEQIANNQVICHLCPHHCRIKAGNNGICRVRYNHEGKLYTKNYGLCSPPALDPIEKKPLYHFYPGSLVLSVGTFGCNFQCSFCQNWHLAHGEPSLYKLEPQDLLQMAETYKEEGSIGIAYTYSEPVVWFEFVKDTAKLVHEQGLKNILVTNGFIEAEPLKEILPFLDAFNLDIKGFNQNFYRKIVKGNYLPVLKTAEEIYREGKHLEITTLLIPGLNDEEEEIEELTQWIAKNLGKEVPIHFSRYSPNYQMDLPPTSLEKLIKAKEIGMKNLDYVYIGNAPELNGSNTHCSNCGQLLIERRRFQVRLINLKGKVCGYCGKEINLAR